MNSRKTITLSVYREGREIDRAVLAPSQTGLTVGQSPLNDVSVSIPGIPDRHRLAERRMFGNHLLIPQNIDGSIDTGAGDVSLKGIIGLGLMKKKGDSYILRMPKDGSCRLKVGDFTLLFDYMQVEKKKRGEMEAILPKRPWIAKDDRQFMLFLLVAATINFSMAGYLRTVEIKKVEQVEALKQMPARFAKLIFKPEMIKEKKASVKPKTEEKEEKKEEVKKENKEQAEEHQAEASRNSATADSSSGGVRSKGLLGLVTSKARPDILSDSIFETGDGPAQTTSAGSASGRSRSADVLAGLSVQGVEGVSIDSSVYSQGKKAKGVEDILKEKKDMLVSANKGQRVRGGAEPNEDVSARKRNDEEVARTVLSYVGGVKYLYNNSLRKDPSLHGKITVKLVISSEGKVIKVEKVSSSLNAPELEEAIVNRVYKWQFPEEKGVGDYVVTYTFDFSPTG